MVSSFPCLLGLYQLPSLVVLFGISSLLISVENFSLLLLQIFFMHFVILPHHINSSFFIVPFSFFTLCISACISFLLFILLLYNHLPHSSSTFMRSVRTLRISLSASLQLITRYGRSCNPSTIHPPPLSPPTHTPTLFFFRLRQEKCENPDGNVQQFIAVYWSFLNGMTSLLKKNLREVVRPREGFWS